MTGLLVNEPGAFEGYTLFAIGAVYLVDHMGRLVHTMEPVIEARMARLLDNGNFLTSETLEIDPSGNMVWRYPHLPQNHDLLKLPNGNVLILSHVITPYEEVLALGANPNKFSCPYLRTPTIVELRPTGPADGEVVWRWSALDHLVQDFDPEKPRYGAAADHPELMDMNYSLPETCDAKDRADWLHANALDYNAELDQIMVTFRHISEIWVIDHSTSIEEAAGHSGGNSGKGGDILYRWGNPHAYQRGTAADQRLFSPHAAHWIPEGLPGAGNVLIFNNGNEYLGQEDTTTWRSSVDEIALPADGYAYRLDKGSAYGPNEVVWRYAAAPWFSAAGSNAQRLPNGNTLITDYSAIRILEVTREGKTVWEFAPPLENSVYRAYRYAPDHPGLRGLDLTPYRTAYRAAVAGEPAARSEFDLHVVAGDLVYVKEACDQEDTEHPFFLHIVPERAEDLQQGRRRGFDDHPADFFLRGGALFDGKCSMRVPLPDYPVAAVRTGQRSAQDGADLWSASFRLNSEPQRAAHRAATAGEPISRSAFDLYLTDVDLVYVKETCDQRDIQDRFYLHIVPERAADLPRERREFGFANLDFDFFLRGALFAGHCVATVSLPDYPIASIRTGQFVRGEGELWSAEFAVGDGA